MVPGLFIMLKMLENCAFVERTDVLSLVYCALYIKKQNRRGCQNPKNTVLYSYKWSEVEESGIKNHKSGAAAPKVGDCFHVHG